MRCTTLGDGILLLWLLTAATAFAAGGAVSVSFISPERYTDAGATKIESEENLKSIARHLTGLGQRYLPPTHVLKVEILDVDLAGRERRLGRIRDDVRVLDGKVDWPRIDLRYALEENGSSLQSGEASIADMGYLMHTNTYQTADPLRYEKGILDEWFRSRFVAPRSKSSAIDSR